MIPATIRWSIRIISLVPLALGARWLQLFIFTDYRAHHRDTMVLLGSIAVALGVLMVTWPAVLRPRVRRAKTATWEDRGGDASRGGRRLRVRG